MRRFLSLALALVLSLTLAAPVFAQEPEESPFGDVPLNHWAIEAIRQASEEHIINGMGYDKESGKNLFAPEEPLTAAQFAAIVTQAFYWRDLGRDPAEQGSVLYAGEGEWYVLFKETAEKAGLVEGTGIEDWNVPMTRYQMAVMLKNIAANKGIAMPDEAAMAEAQAKIADWDQLPERYLDAVAAAYALGLLSGMADGSFAGNQTLTRGQATMVFCKLDAAIEAVDGPMERALDKAERSLALGVLSYTFTRYPGKLGTAYESSQSGTSHGGVSWLYYVSSDGTELNIRDLLPEGYLFGSVYSLNPSEIQFDETGEKLSFVVRVQELADHSDPSSYMELGKDWGDTRVVVNVVTGIVESMEPQDSQGQ